MMTVRKKLTIFVIVMACLLVTFVLGKSRRNPKFNSESPSVEKFQDKTVETVSTEIIPETYTEDFPMYDKAQIKESWVSNSGEGGAVSIVWESEEAIAEVFEHYQASLDSKGWEISNIIKSDTFAALSFAKNFKSGFLGITKGSSGKTVISVTIGIKDN